ncbi:hypothetical protein [Alistipes shahii]|uniref:hypothetical protein n=1 Tax=Alistipes shahii TaxID=328814 RepID=UPI0026660CC2|nr:hypothetical protein [Alistipes shahii]
MEKSELSTRDRMCSVAGGMAGLLVDREIPSRLIPFRGEFPLLNMIEAIRFREAIRSTMWIEDLPPKFLYAAAEGSRIARLEREFRHYLSRNGLKSGDFEKLEDAEKSEWLRWWMEADSVSADDLVVKKYRDEATPVSKSLGDPAMPVAEKREIYDDLVTRRAYWDDLCFEFGRVSWEKKLLNLALYIHYGGDLEVVLARYKENHPDYADRIPHSLAYYISYLRTGEATSVLHYFLLERVYLSEGQLTALLTAELRERLEEVFCWDGGTNSAWTIGIDYRGEEKMDEIITTLDIEKGREYLIFGNLTIKPFIMETKETLLKENPWRVLAEKIEKNGYMRLEKLNAYADDIPFIEEFNERTKNEPEYQLHTEILPYPFIGDVLGARVVLLMSNPGYKVSSNIEAHEKMSDEEKRFVIRAQTQAMLLEDRAIFYSGPEYKPFNDEQDWYWAKKTRIIREAVPGAETKIAAVQLMAYHSRKYKPFPAKMGLLPSQEYTKRLVKYLIDKNVIFVYARSKAQWLDFVPELENATCVELSSIRNACLSEKNCKDGGFKKIVDALNE